MTELERQLTTALQTLSAQYEREQTRRCEQQAQQAERVAALQQQVERLEGAVTHLTRQYTTLAATLRARWS